MTHMNIDIYKKVQAKSLDKKVPEIKVGDTVEVDTIIREGNKQRIQKFKGLIIAIKGTGVTKMITVRKISYGVGVEKKLPVYSPNIGKIKVIKREPVRRAKLYFMRDRVGKASMRVKKGKAVFVPEEGTPIKEEEIVPVAPAEAVSEAVETSKE